MTNEKLYNEGLRKKDPDTMLKALERQKASCPSANTNCLTQVFCPECPMGWMPVVSGRAEMSAKEHKGRRKLGYEPSFWRQLWVMICYLFKGGTEK